MPNRRPTSFVTSKVVFNEQNDKGEWISLSLVRNQTYQMQVRHVGSRKVTPGYAQIESFCTEDSQKVKIRWVFEKKDMQALDVDALSAVRSAPANTLWLSDYRDIVDTKVFIQPVSLFHRDVAVGTYGKLLTGKLLKIGLLFQYHEFFDHVAMQLRSSPLPPFTGVESEFHSQPGVMSSEQTRARFNEGFFCGDETYHWV
jgi:hypothetical protein